MSAITNDGSLPQPYMPTYIWDFDINGLYIRSYSPCCMWCAKIMQSIQNRHYPLNGVLDAGSVTEKRGAVTFHQHSLISSRLSKQVRFQAKPGKCIAGPGPGPVYNLSRYF